MIKLRRTRWQRFVSWTQTLHVTIGWLHIAPWHVWKFMLHKNWGENRVGVFKNLPWVIPGRWGIYIIGFEFGSRSPGNPTGVWLKNHGLWPW